MVAATGKTHEPTRDAGYIGGKMNNKQHLDSKTHPELPLWTVERVKGELPEVRVRLAPKQYVFGRVLGRCLAYPSVLLPDGRYVQFTWDGIARALNKKKPLCV
jgi:hypothetical protein